MRNVNVRHSIGAFLYSYGAFANQGLTYTTGLRCEVACKQQKQTMQSKQARNQTNQASETGDASKVSKHGTKQIESLASRQSNRLKRFLKQAAQAGKPNRTLNKRQQSNESSKHVESSGI